MSFIFFSRSIIFFQSASSKIQGGMFKNQQQIEQVYNINDNTLLDFSLIINCMQLIANQDLSAQKGSHGIDRKQIIQLLKLDQLIEEYGGNIRSSIKVKEILTQSQPHTKQNSSTSNNKTIKPHRSTRKVLGKQSNRKEQVLYQNYGSNKRCQSERVFKKKPQKAKQPTERKNRQNREKSVNQVNKTSSQFPAEQQPSSIKSKQRYRSIVSVSKMDQIVVRGQHLIQRNTTVDPNQNADFALNEQQKLRKFIDKYKSSYRFAKQKDKQADKQYLQIEKIANKIRVDQQEIKTLQVCHSNQYDVKQIEQIPQNRNGNTLNALIQRKLKRKTPLINKTLKDRYKLLTLIGHGLSGSVYKAKDILSDRFVAIKIIDPNSQYQIEYEFFKEMQHANIVSYYNNFIQTGKRYIVLEYFPDTLHSMIKNRTFSQNQVKHIFKNVANGLMYLHGLSIAHRDIKLDNVVISKNLQVVKFIDFGLCIDMSKDQAQLSKQFCGTLQYMPPQILERKQYNPKKADIWSLGVLLYCLCFKRFPYKGKDEGEILSKIHRSKIVFSQDVDENLKDLINEMLKISPKSRISVIQAYNHAWLTQ